MIFLPILNLLGDHVTLGLVQSVDGGGEEAVAVALGASVGPAFPVFAFIGVGQGFPTFVEHLEVGEAEAAVEIEDAIVTPRPLIPLCRAAPDRAEKKDKPEHPVSVA